MRDSSNAQNPGAGNKVLFAWLAVAAIFLIALFLRVYWNFDAATENGFVLSAGSDPYYHKRAIDYIQSNGWTTLIRDPLLNYPYGAVNPNPPLFEWSVALTGAALAPFFSATDSMSALEVSTWWVFEWSPAVWGALTVIPTYLIGRDVFNRRTGVIGAFLLAVSTTHIDHSAFGAADHDATLLFFAVFAFWAYIRAIQGFRGDGNWVEKWSDGASVSTGIGRFFRERRSALGWSVLTGVLVGAVGLIWKGFPYLIGVMFAYVAIQLIVDHWRNKDSLGLWVGTLVAFLVAMLMVTPFYAQSNVAGFLKPVWFLILAHVLYGLVMVPTRDLPTILVIPAGVVAAALLAAGLYVFSNETWRSLLYATVYFKQTSLYKTIAEAHPADFNTMVFGIGPIVFLLGVFIGLPLLVWRAVKFPARAYLFTLVWAALAIYMAHSAVRFLFNATPILAILGAWVIALGLDWLDYGSIGKKMAGASSFWGGVRRAVNGWHVLGAVLVALLLVFPSVFLAVDAATPAEAEARMSENADSDFMKDFVQKRLGAFGQGYLPAYWNEGLTNLSKLNDYGSDPGNVANRPGFVSWWDYGHWAIEVGEHPAVADNFQNGYEYAANFLLAQNETHAVQLLSARSLDRYEGTERVSTGLVAPDVAKTLLNQSGVPQDQVEATYAQLTAWDYAPALTIGRAVQLEKLIGQATKSDLRPDGVRIRYFAADIRMLPYDLPSTPGYIEQSSIFYAPVILGGEGVRPANCDPSRFSTDDIASCYVEVKIQDTTGRFVTTKEFERNARDVLRYPQYSAAGQKYEYKQPFFNSMYYRAFVGTPIDASGSIVEGDQVDRALQLAAPAYGLEHFRLVIANDQLRILEYFEGAIVKGKVLEDGAPVKGVTVTAYDDAGAYLHTRLSDAGRAAITADQLNVPHATTETNDDGEFELRVPFSTVSNTTVIVSDGPVELAREAFVVSREDASSGKVFDQTFTVKRGNVEGRVFLDADENGEFNATKGDELLSGVDVRIGDKRAVTGDNGAYVLNEVRAGNQPVTVNSTRYQLAPTASTAAVKPGETTTFDVPLRLKPTPVSGEVSADKNGNGAADDGEAVPSTTVSFVPAPGSTGKIAGPRTNANGTFEARIFPGAYTVYVNYTSEGTAYSHQKEVTIPLADQTPGEVLDFLLARKT